MNEQKTGGKRVGESISKLKKKNPEQFHAQNPLYEGVGILSLSSYPFPHTTMDA